jgi:hypothetical protein
MAANYTVPPIIGTLKLNNGRVATFYETERGSYDRALASGATTVEPPPADTTVVDGETVSATANVPPPADIVTTGQSQSTPANNANDDAPIQAPTSGGVGAGTGQQGGDDTPGPSTAITQQAMAVFSTSSNQSLIQTQPNQLDQYASYTYSISWYLLSIAQFNAMKKSSRPNVSGWQLLMQSGGAPAKGRSPAFPVDYYMDDLEITSSIWGGGKKMYNNAMALKFRVTEPNGITLIQSIFNAVDAVYGGGVSGGKPNYLTAHYALVIQFYGYDSNGNLVAPVKGGDNGGYSQSAVITKYYPFQLVDIKFSVVSRAIEYAITGAPAPYRLNSSSDRGTIPTNFTMTGQTVDQLLNGKPISVRETAATGQGELVGPPAPYVQSLPMQQQAAIAAGTDPNAVSPDGMAFGGGGL